MAIAGVGVTLVDRPFSDVAYVLARLVSRDDTCTECYLERLAGCIPGTAPFRSCAVDAASALSSSTLVMTFMDAEYPLMLPAKFRP